MDSSDSSRSNKIPIEVTVSSDIEPLVGRGCYTALDDGFIMEFEAGSDKYIITHSAKCTRLSSDGAVSYALQLGDETSASSLSTPFGKMDMGVVTEARNVEVSPVGVKLGLKYALEVQGEKQSRCVNVCATFSQSNQKG